MLRDFFSRLFVRRFAFEIMVIMAVLVVGINEYTYRSTTTVLRGGISLTDERIAAARLLQLLTDAETGQRGYLLTQDPSFLAPYKSALQLLPQVRLTVVPFLDVHNPITAKQVNDIINAKLSEMASTVELVERGQIELATDIVKAGSGRDWMGQLRQLINTELASAARRQTQARLSIYDALSVNHVGVILLTLSSVVAFYAFIRQVRLQQGERVQTQAKLEAKVEQRTQELRELAKHLQIIREVEKDHLARELHDELGALLTVAKLELEGLRRRVETTPDMVARVERVSSRINQVIVLKRRMVEDMRPSSLTMLGLQSALEQLCRDMANALDVPFHVSIAKVKLTPESDLVVYRFFQEALTNVAKYSDAKNVWVELVKAGEQLHLTIRDDGVGFDTQVALAGRHGLTGMRYRMDSLGGAMTLASAPGRGTTVGAVITL